MRNMSSSSRKPTKQWQSAQKRRLHAWLQLSVLRVEHDKNERERDKSRRTNCSDCCSPIRLAVAAAMEERVMPPFESSSHLQQARRSSRSRGAKGWIIRAQAAWRHLATAIVRTVWSRAAHALHCGFSPDCPTLRGSLLSSQLRQMCLRASQLYLRRCYARRPALPHALIPLHRVAPHALREQLSPVLVHLRRSRRIASVHGLARRALSLAIPLPAHGIAEQTRRLYLASARRVRFRMRGRSCFVRPIRVCHPRRKLLLRAVFTATQAVACWSTHLHENCCRCDEASR